jgi:hypothetical protein
VIPDKVKMGGTVRTLNEEVRAKMLETMERIVNGWPRRMVPPAPSSTGAATGPSSMTRG